MWVGGGVVDMRKEGLAERKNREQRREEGEERRRERREKKQIEKGEKRKSERQKKDRGENREEEARKKREGGIKRRESSHSACIVVTGVMVRSVSVRSPKCQQNTRKNSACT
jgi:hypothetical protein